MTATKVKPVVVKHVLDNQVMSIYEIKVSLLELTVQSHMEEEHKAKIQREKGAPLPQNYSGTSIESSRYTAQTNGVSYFTAKPQEENKQLLEKLREGMQGLLFLKEQRAENFEAQAQANLN